MLLKILNSFYINHSLNCTFVGRFLNFLSVKLYLACIACVHAGSIKIHQNLCIWLWCVCSFPPGTVKEHHIHNENDKICLSQHIFKAPCCTAAFPDFQGQNVSKRSMDAVKGLHPVCLKAFLKSQLTACWLLTVSWEKPWVLFNMMFQFLTGLWCTICTVCSLWRLSHDLFGCVSVYYLSQKRW